MTSLIVTLIGRDRPGLVEELAGVVAEGGGSWDESSLARLSGRFAGVVRVTLPDGEAARARGAIEALGERQGLRLTIETAEPGEAHAEEIVGATLRLEVVGLDRPGIVRDVAHALASRGVNVVAFDSDVFNAPMSGERMFLAHARLTPPADVDRASLDAALDAVAEALQVEIQLQDEA